MNKINEKVIFDQLLKKVDWIKGIVAKRKWDLTQDLIVEEPATEAEITIVENRIGCKIPEDYKTLFRFSRHVEFSYQFNEEMPGEFMGNFSGELYWDLGRLSVMMDYFKKWVEGSLDPEYNDVEAIQITQKLWRGKIPLLEVANGDIIVVGDSPSEIVYFSHEGDVMHGKKLGDNLWDFLEFHSRIGFAGSEDGQFEPFFDFENDKMLTHGKVVDKYV